MMLSKRKVGLCVLMAAAFTMGVACMAAANIKATVMTAQGTVEYQPAGSGEWKAAQPGVTLGAGAAIRCAAASEAMIRWADGNVMKIFALTAVTLDRLSVDANGIEDSQITMNDGTALITADRLKPGSEVKLATPSAVAGVRGSALFGQMVAGGAEFGCMGGSCFAGTETVSPGNMIFFGVTGVFSPPRAIPPALQQTMQQSMSEAAAVAEAPAPAPPPVDAADAIDAIDAIDSIDDNVTDAIDAGAVQDALEDISADCCQHNTQFDYGAGSYH